MTLTVSDPHHWAPIPQVVSWLCDRLPAQAKALEIGPGHTPFPRADTFVDFIAPEKKNWHKIDLANEPLPFANKSFDFVYCRHMLEDMFNPFAVCSEMERVGKAGYIETPSPIAELCRGVDGNAPPYRGYHHHRFVAWEQTGELRFVSKYPLIEYLQFDDAGIAKLLRSDPKYWNTYHLWTGRINVVHRQSPLDFDIPSDYRPLLCGAIAQSRASADAFFAQGIPDQSTIRNLTPAYA